MRPKHTRLGSTVDILMEDVTLLTALKLDEHPLVNQVMYIEELNTADGSFILSTVIKLQIERNHNIILVMCHNSLGHFHSISQKLGYNLMFLKESGRICTIDILEKILNEDFLISVKPLHLLYNEIKNQCDKWGNEKGVCVIVENIGNFLLGDMQDILIFINYLRAIVVERKDSSLVFSMHNIPNESNFNFINKSVKHFADIGICLKGLQTGRAFDVTGHLSVTKTENKYKKVTTEYQYLLQDKSISVFTPGSRNFI